MDYAEFKELLIESDIANTDNVLQKAYKIVSGRYNKPECSKKLKGLGLSQADIEVILKLAGYKKNGRRNNSE